MTDRMPTDTELDAMMNDPELQAANDHADEALRKLEESEAQDAE